MARPSSPRRPTIRRSHIDPGRVPRTVRTQHSGDMTTNQPRSAPDHRGTVLIILALVLGMLGIALHLQPAPLLDLVVLIPAGILMLAGLHRTATLDASRSTWHR